MLTLQVQREGVRARGNRSESETGGGVGPNQREREGQVCRMCVCASACVRAWGDACVFVCACACVRACE